MDYAGLQTSIQNWSARSDAETIAEIPTMIGFAEDGFNHGIPERTIAPLRVREMLDTTALTPNGDGEVTLPDDYLQFRAVTSDASIARDLTGIAPTFATQNYAGSGAGLSNNFTLIGNVLKGYPMSSSDVTLLYYQKIPSLSVSNTTNWLLAKMPSLYLHASLLQVGLFTKDNELIQRSAALVASMIDGLNATDQLSQYSRAGTNMGMLTP